MSGLPEHYCPACQPDAFPDHRPDDDRYFSVWNGAGKERYRRLRPFHGWLPYLDGVALPSAHSALLDDREGIVWFHHRDPQLHICPSCRDKVCQRVAFGRVELRPIDEAARAR